MHTPKTIKTKWFHRGVAATKQVNDPYTKDSNVLQVPTSIRLSYSEAQGLPDGQESQVGAAGGPEVDYEGCKVKSCENP